MVNNNTRGSEWNKWDLHIHTPFTGKNDQFTGSSKDEKWDNYLTKIEQNNDVKVLGITDYFSIAINTISSIYSRLRTDRGNLNEIIYNLPTKSYFFFSS